MLKKLISGVRWVVSLVGLWLCISCHHTSTQTPLPLPGAFQLAGVYSIQAIQVEPALKSGTDILALYDDSTGSSPCLRNAQIQFDSNGFIKLIKPVGCESNQVLTEVTQLQYGEHWSLEGNQLVTGDSFQTTQYTVLVDGQTVVLKLGIEQGYASSLDENDTGYILSIELRRL